MFYFSHLVLSCLHRKLLHKRSDGKDVAQEENFLPKYQRVKDLCQRTEYQTPCQQLGQVGSQEDPNTNTPTYTHTHTENQACTHARTHTVILTRTFSSID